MLRFVGIPKIQYNPSAPVDDVLCFRHYNAQEVLIAACFNYKVSPTKIGCIGTDYGELAAILCLLLAHVQRNRSPLYNIYYIIILCLLLKVPTHLGSQPCSGPGTMERSLWKMPSGG